MVEAAHKPVLTAEVVASLAAAKPQVLLDATVGLGGHAEALLDALPAARLVGIDLDESNLAVAKRRLERFAPRFRLFQANFADAADVLAAAEVETADAILADLGAASSQFDDPSRGFSFSADGLLDMRMDAGAGATAADLVNNLGEAELADLIYEYGEERYSRRIARAIIAERRNEPILRTVRLAEVIASAIPAPARSRRRGVHPATRTFQALRIAVNDELGNLAKLLDAVPGILAVGGRAAIISFHSLEDRLVKRAFAAWATTKHAKLLTKKPTVASPQEVADNPRSRSAKLRTIERTA